jgi:hypothetical protein
MSSRKGARGKPATPKTARRPRPARTEVRPARKSANGSSAEAAHLAAVMERALAEGRTDLLTPEAVQALMAAVCKTYAAQNEGA